ncbi:MAG TPA: iron ABC transporter permease [Anaerolineae bacterium]|nr:iron ABC transporter permease [Anaerolineae bacterium]
MPFIKQHPYIINTTIFGLAFLLSIALGSVFIPPDTILRLLLAPLINLPLDAPTSYTTIIWQVRLPHTFLITLTGAALASSGAAYQGLFRNPLADPYLIGVASGAGLGAVLAMSYQWPQTPFGFYIIPFAAFCGALITVLIVYTLAYTPGRDATHSLILAGVAISSFATALTSYLMLRSDEEMRRALGWLLGGALLGGWQPVITMLPYLTIGITALFLSTHALNLLQFGEEQAHQLGLNVKRQQRIIILAASLTTATAVAFTGIIGFIGLIVPHLTRILWGTDYRHLLPIATIAGSTTLLLADLIARIALAPQLLPVGIVTALTGAPFFLWILFSSQRTK